MRRSIPFMVAPFLAAAASAPSTTPSSQPAAIPPVVPINGKLGAPIPLFNGKDLAGWTWRSTAAPASKINDLFTIKDGILHLAGTPAPKGYIATDKPYKNFVLTVEQRHLTRDNGGIFICITDEKSQWPDAIQVQGKFGAVGDLINQNAGMKKMTTDPARTAKAGKDILITRIHPNTEKKLGEWNTVVITMQNGNLSVTVNDILQNTAADVTPDSGKIGLQAEGAEMEFRKVELTPIEEP